MPLISSAISNEVNGDRRQRDSLSVIDLEQKRNEKMPGPARPPRLADPGNSDKSS
jgi:hypothetical protein